MFETALFPIAYSELTDKLYSLYWVATGIINAPSRKDWDGSVLVRLSALVPEEDFDPAVGHTDMGTLVFQNGRTANAFLRFLSGRKLTDELIRDAIVAAKLRYEEEMAEMSPIRHRQSWVKTS